MAGHFITEPQRLRMLGIASNHGFSFDDVKVLILNLYRARSTTQLLRSEYEDFCQNILPAGRRAAESSGFYQEGA